MQCLTDWMRMPRRARTRLKRDAIRFHSRRRGSCDNFIDPHRSCKPCLRSFTAASHLIRDYFHGGFDFTRIDLPDYAAHWTDNFQAGSDLSCFYKEKTMKAVGYKKPLPIDDPESLLDIEIPVPEAKGRDLLVEVNAVSVNPVDIKVRASAKPDGAEYKILGWDAAGVVKQAGPDCTLFKPGDEVYYAGSIARPGTDAEFHLVDERIVGKKPSSLNFAHAAALPLTTITAWELLFDRFGVPMDETAKAGNILIIGGAGGVGSIMIQLARKLTGLNIVATASRPETQQWCHDLGAHHVIDHSKPMAEQLHAIGLSAMEYIASLTATDVHYPAVVEVLAPQGKFGLIDDPKSIDAKPLKRKAASLHWEFMFARPVYETPDILEQHRLLNKVSELVDAGVIRTTASDVMGTINAANLKKAHALIESGRARGKVVLAGF
jgi:NADPH2:quinone reductase